MSSPCHINTDYFAGCQVQGIMMPPSPDPQGLREPSTVSPGTCLQALRLGALRGCSGVPALAARPAPPRPASLRPTPPQPAGHPAPRRRPLAEVGGMGEPQRALHSRSYRVSRGAAAGTGARGGHLGA